MNVDDDNDGLTQDCGNSSANALELQQYCAKPFINNVHSILFCKIMI